MLFDRIRLVYGVLDANEGVNPAAAMSRFRLQSLYDVREDEKELFAANMNHDAAGGSSSWWDILVQVLQLGMFLLIPVVGGLAILRLIELLLSSGGVFGPKVIALD